MFGACMVQAFVMLGGPAATGSTHSGGVTQVLAVPICYTHVVTHEVV